MSSRIEQDLSIFTDAPRSHLEVADNMLTRPSGTADHAVVDPTVRLFITEVPLQALALALDPAGRMERAPERLFGGEESVFRHRSGSSFG
jgi:hypothetical protein